MKLLVCRLFGNEVIGILWELSENEKVTYRSHFNIYISAD